MPSAHDLAIARHRCLTAPQRREGAGSFGFAAWLSRHWDPVCPPTPARAPDADGDGPCRAFTRVRWFEDGDWVFGYEDARPTGCYRVPRDAAIPARALPPLRHHVVVVEGEATARESLRAALAARGYHVSVFAHPPAPDDLLSEDPDLLVLDLDCGDGAAFDLLHALRRHPDGSRLPVVACSSVDDVWGRVLEDPRLAWVAGLRKPLGVDDLDGTLPGPDGRGNPASRAMKASATG